MIELEFVDFLPPDKRGSNQGVVLTYEPHLAALRARPGQWAIVDRNIPATRLRKLRSACPGFEFVLRDHVEEEGKRRATLYGRFVGALNGVKPAAMVPAGSVPYDEPRTPAFPARPGPKVLKCRSHGCDFLCEVSEMPKMAEHCRREHMRQPTQAERVPRVR